MKDALGHGSNPRGGSGAFSDQQHRQARQQIQLHPNDPNPSAENVLKTFGYGPGDIQRLRQNAGAMIQDGAPAAHQTGVENATRLASLTPAVLRGVAGVDAPVGKDLTPNLRKKFGTK